MIEESSSVRDSPLGGLFFFGKYPRLSARNSTMRLLEQLPTDPRERRKLLIAGGAAILSAVWLLYWLTTSVRWSGPTRPIDTSDARLVADLNAKLLEHPEFADVGFSIASERPLKLKVVGVVQTPEELQSLQALLTQIRPEGDFEVDVQSLHAGR